MSNQIKVLPCHRCGKVPSMFKGGGGTDHHSWYSYTKGYIIECDTLDCENRFLAESDSEEDVVRVWNEEQRGRKNGLQKIKERLGANTKVS